MRNDLDLWRMTSGALFLSAVTMLVGCDNNPPPSSSVAETVESTPAAPSVNNTPRRVKLEVAPFTVEVPPDWSVEPNPLATAIVLRGPKAKDDPEGFLARQGTIKQHEDILNERMTSMIDRFKLDGDKEDDTDVTVYVLGPITAVEIMHRAPSVTTQPTDKVEMLVQQTFHIFGPGADGKKTWSEIRFPHATVAEYETDREVLTKIINSLQLPEDETTQPVEP